MVEALLLLLDLPTQHGEVQHLDEVRDVHAGVLYNLLVLLVSINLAVEVRHVLADSIFILEQAVLRLCGQAVRQHLLGKIALRSTLHGSLQRAQTSLVSIG